MGKYPQTPKIALEMLLACAGLRAFIFRRCCAFGPVQVSELKAAKNFMFAMCVPWCTQNHCKNQCFQNKAGLESENAIRCRFLAFQTLQKQTFVVIYKVELLKTNCVLQCVQASARKRHTNFQLEEVPIHVHIYIYTHQKKRKQKSTCCWCKGSRVILDGLPKPKLGSYNIYIYIYMYSYIQIYRTLHDPAPLHETLHNVVFSALHLPLPPGKGSTCLHEANRSPKALESLSS